MGLSDIEICTNCGRVILRSEQAYVFEDKIVCEECDRKLRSGPQPRSAGMPELQRMSPGSTKLEEEQAGEEQNWFAGKRVGFVVAGICLVLLGVNLISIGVMALGGAFLLRSGILIVLGGGCVVSGTVILVTGVASIMVATLSGQDSRQ